MPEQNEPKQKPAKVFRCGAVSVSVWRRENNGEVFYNATPSRAFTRDDGKTWEYSDSFRTDELATVAQLLNLAFNWITFGADK